MKRILVLFFVCVVFNHLYAQKPLSLASSFYNTLNNYVLYNDYIEYQKLINMCDAGFRVSDRFAQEQTDIPSPSLLLQNYLELLRDKQVKLAITDMREITLSNHRTGGAPTKIVLVNVTFSSPKTSTYKLQNVVYIRNNKIFCVGDYEVDKSGKVLTDVVNKTNRTSTNNNIHNGHEYVDLGLSVMWATCNVGASTPEEYGDYFAWGELHPKYSYSWDTYKFIEKKKLTKYCMDKKDGYKGMTDQFLLKSADDVAYANWGTGWRIPQFVELQELRDLCTWEWKERNGVKGYKITGPNGNSIFLPASGYKITSEDRQYPITSIYSKNKCGYYWTNMLDWYYMNSYYAISMGFSEKSIRKEPQLRRHGLPIRPVFTHTQ